MIYRYKNTQTNEIIESKIKLYRLKHNIIDIGTVTGVVDVLVIRRALGDILMLLPVIKMWRKQRLELNKKMGITIATDIELIPFIKRIEFISDVVPYNTIKQTNYKEVYQLEGTVDFINKEDRKHRSLLFADSLYDIWSKYNKTTDYEYNPNKIKVENYFKLTKTEIEDAKQTLRLYNWQDSRPLIAVSPTSKSKFRRWGSELSLIEACPQYDFVVLNDKHIDIAKSVPNMINLTGETNIIQMVSILNLCNAAVFPDSGLMHVAGVLGIPTIAIFGKVIPSENRVAYYPNVYPVESSCPLTDYCYDSQFTDCSNTVDYRKCMSLISVDKIMSMLADIL